MIRRKHIKYLFILFIFALSTEVYAESGKPPDPASVARGKILYVKNCQTCHQKEGVGEKPVPPSIRQPGFVAAMPLDDTSHAWHHEDKAILNTILNGTPSTKRMPAWKSKLTVAQAKDIVSYVKSLWSPQMLACQGPKHMSCKKPANNKK